MIEESQLAGNSATGCVYMPEQSSWTGATQNKLVVKLGHQHEIIGFQVRRINYADTLPPKEQNVKKKKEIVSKDTLSCRPQITLPKLRLALFWKHHQLERKKKVLPRDGKKNKKDGCAYWIWIFFFFYRSQLNKWCFTNISRTPSFIGWVTCETDQTDI